MFNFPCNLFSFDNRGLESCGIYEVDRQKNIVVKITQSFELNCTIKTAGAVAALSHMKLASSWNSGYLFSLKFKFSLSFYNRLSI
jgi:hypothetical protein